MQSIAFDSTFRCTAIEEGKMDAIPSEDDNSKQSSKSKKRLCDHCDSLISIQTYNGHKQGRQLIHTPTHPHTHTPTHKYVHTLFVNVGRKVAAKKTDVDLPII